MAQSDCQSSKETGEETFMFVLRFSEVGLLFQEAENLCNSLSINGDGHLARISNFEEYTLVGEFLDGFGTPAPGSEDELWIGLSDPGQGSDDTAQHNREDYRFTDGVDNRNIRDFVASDVPWFSNDPAEPLTSDSCVVYYQYLSLKLLFII